MSEPGKLPEPIRPRPDEFAFPVQAWDVRGTCLDLYSLPGEGVVEDGCLVGRDGAPFTIGT